MGSHSRLPPTNSSIRCGATPAAHGLTAAAAGERLARDGPNDVPERKSNPLWRFAHKFWGLSAWMIELIAALSFVLGKLVDFWIALSLLVINAVLSFLQEQRASTAVAALRSRLQVSARVLRDGGWQSKPARELVADDVIRVRSGDFVPADARIIDGNLTVDESALTGESRELHKAPNDTVFSGCIVRHGEATAMVTATGLRTYFGRTIQLVASAHPRLHVEAVVSRVVRWLFVIVGTLVALTLVMSILEGLPLAEILPLSLVLLMSAVPVALPVMFTVTMAVGSLELARQGVLVTRLSAAEDAAGMQILCTDKTGTLTMNRLALVGIRPQPGYTDEGVLHAAALASSEADQDPIDAALLRAARERNLLRRDEERLSFEPFSATTRRTEARIRIDGSVLHVMKGAFATIAQLCNVDAVTLAALETHAADAASKGLRTLAVARSQSSAPPQLIGTVLLQDQPRPDSRRLVDELRALGVSVKMLTGDSLPVAREIARELGLGPVTRMPRQAPGSSPAPVDQLIRGAESLAEIFPEEKFLVVKQLQAAGRVVGMNGDGVNDAPALRQAEVGIAVSGATDVAKGAASVVLTTEGLSGIVDLVKGGRAIYQRVLTWIVNKISRTVLKAGFVVVAFLVTGKFVISALGMMLLVFMTDFVKIALSTDRVHHSRAPETWNIGPWVRIAALLGLAMLVEALALLAFSWDRFDLAHHPRQLQTFAFQTLLFFALFSILSIRERRAFWKSRPSAILTVALLVDALLGIAIGWQGIGDLRPVSPALTAIIVGSAAILSLGVNDAIKQALVMRVLKPPA